MGWRELGTGTATWSSLSSGKEPQGRAINEVAKPRSPERNKRKRSLDCKSEAWTHGLWMRGLLLHFLEATSPLGSPRGRQAGAGLQIGSRR